MRPIATNIADFETMRKAGLVYVDKTAHLHRLITTPGSTFFFCARPRRFGKSLSVTTMKSIFLGHREFFDGLAIASTDYDWKKHVVIHLNWGKVDVSNLGEFEETLKVAVCDALTAAGYAYDEKIPPSANLGRAIDHFGSIRHDPENEPDKGDGVVILIDEYDDPVAKALANFIKREGALSIDPDRTVSAVDTDFDVADLSNIRETGLLFQTGYLTIADCDAGLFTLRVPDEEVRQDLAALVAGAYEGKVERVQ